MNRLLNTLLLLFMSVGIYSQQISREEVNSLLDALAKSKPDTARINLLLKIARFHLFKPVKNKTGDDSAFVFITQAKSLNNTIRSREADGYIALAESCYYRISGQRAKGKVSIQQAIDILKNGTNNSLIGQAWFEMSNYYDYDFKDTTIRNRIYFLEKAISALKQSSEIAILAYCFSMLGDLHHLISQYPKATEELKLSLSYYQSIRYKELQNVYSLLGKVYYLQGDYEQALEHEFKALKIAGDNHDTTMVLCGILNNLGFIYYKLNDNENAAGYFRRSIEVAEKEKDIRSVYLVASNVAEAYLKLKKPRVAKNFLDSINNKYARPKDKIYEAGDVALNKVYLRIYVALKQYDNATFYCNELIRETRNARINLSLLSAYYVEIIQYYIATTEYLNALVYLKKNRAVLDSLKDFVGMARNYNLWFSLDTSRGNYISATQYLLQANKLNDAIFNETKSRQLQQLNVQYESDKKESDIKYKDQQIKVLEQQDQLREASLRQANLVKNVTIAGIFVLLATGFIFYRLYRLKKRTNNIITYKNEQLEHLLKEKEWLLKEVNHRVKNNLQMIFGLLECQATYLENDALKAIENSQRRIYAMSLIHQKLYQLDNIKTIDMSKYFSEFIPYLSDSFGASGNIRCELSIDEIELDVSRAIPVALIVNEGVTNSMKYAFPGGRRGTINIAMHKTGKDISLEIADNGIGIKLHAGEVQSSSLGLELIKGLTGDIEGECKFQNDNGTKISIRFNHMIVN